MTKKIGFTTIHPVGDKPSNRSVDIKTSTPSPTKKISPLDAHDEFVAYYSKKQEELIGKLKKKFPDGATITEGEFISTK